MSKYKVDDDVVINGLMVGRIQLVFSNDIYSIIVNQNGAHQDVALVDQKYFDAFEENKR